MWKRVDTWVAIAVGAALPLVLFYGCNWKYYRHYVGKPEVEVIETLGPPDYDSRQWPDYREGESFRLGWYYWIGGNVSLRFDEGVVVSQSRSSK